ncbi:CopG family transcriptional regulator [Longimonas halophila]|uniref:CopG family transcriptional regulator n=1 Tax=Longimonas halophila TaxID=1469170 RepID=A0A2H3NLC4_9BACT|nr:DUF411 domain-containing protein [Longimonas halophila]PEN05217.1 CopG family transcriptional regulator [Longimonas halophila]
MFSNLSIGATLKSLGVGVALAVALLFGLSQTGVISGTIPGFGTPLPTITVYQSPTCGCCGKWVQHLEAEGFTVASEMRQDMRAVKQQAGVPQQLSSCHTAIVDDYVIEGHVPADDIKALLSNAPDGIQGLTVPGMPVGSPGMEQGNRLDPYDVLAFTSEGGTRVVASYGQ